jgi:hypothetical protein
MQRNEARRDSYRERIREGQRRAVELSIELQLDAGEEDDERRLAETVDILEAAVESLERAHGHLVAV